MTSFARDPHLDFLLARREPAADALEVTRPVEPAQRHYQRRVELVQVPAQALLRPPPLVDETVAMVNEQLDLAMHLLSWLGPRQVRLTQRRPRHRKRVDWVGLPARPAGASFRQRQLGRDPHQLLT